MKKILPIMALSAGLIPQVHAQKEQPTDSSTVNTVKRPTEVVIRGDAGTNSPIREINEDNGYFLNIAQPISDNFSILAGGYHSDKPDFVTNSWIGGSVSHKKTSLKGRLLIPLGDRSPSTLVESNVGLGAFNIEAGHWNFLNGNNRNWLGASVKCKIGKSKNAFLTRLRVFHMLNGDFDTASTVAQLSAQKLLGNGWDISATLQGRRQKSQEIDFNVGFSVTKKFNLSKKRVRK